MDVDLNNKDMDEKLIRRIIQFNEIKFGGDDNEARIIVGTLRPIGTVTTASKVY